MGINIVLIALLNKEISMIKVALFLMMSMSFSTQAFETGGLPLVSTPKQFECWPKAPTTKRYIDTKKIPFYKEVTFSCIYLCMNLASEIEEVIGIRTVRIFGREKGNESVCRGYEKDMVFIETPLNPKSWGHYELGKVRPFQAKSSKIKEIERWYKEQGAAFIPFKLH